MSQNVPIVIPDKVWQQIQHLLREIPRQEWSGILFYRTEGAFGTDEFKCILEYIFLMNIGDWGFTQYDYDVNVAKLMMEKPSLFDCKIGHIHSHHSLDVFFSGTDQNELKENSAFHNFYLSVIVNNPSEVIAKIAFRATDVQVSTHKLSFRDEKGQWVEKMIEDTVKTKDIFCVHECSIVGPDRELEPLFEQRLDEIKRISPNYLGKNSEVSHPKSDFSSQAYKMEQKSLFPDYDLVKKDYQYTVEEFISTLVLQDINPRVPVAAALLEIDQIVDIEALGNSIVSNAVAHYEHCFPNDPELLAFVATMGECVEILSELSASHLLAEVLMPYFDLELVN